MKAIWTGTVSFGAVNVPVKLAPATDDKKVKVSFNFLHQCGEQIKQQMFCPVCDRVVKADELVKGYKHEDGFIICDDSEFDKLTSNKVMEIESFVAREKVENNPMLIEKPYFLLGEDGPLGRGYNMLAQGMTRTGTAAITKTVIWGTERTFALIPNEEEVLVAYALRWSKELVQAPPKPRMEITETVLNMMVLFISQHIKPFNPNEWVNEHRIRQMTLIEAKIAGREPPELDEPVVKPVVDLIAALRESIEQAGVA